MKDFKELWRIFITWTAVSLRMTSLKSHRANLIFLSIHIPLYIWEQFLYLTWVSPKWYMKTYFVVTEGLYRYEWSWWWLCVGWLHQSLSDVSLLWFDCFYMAVLHIVNAPFENQSPELTLCPGCGLNGYESRGPCSFFLNYSVQGYRIWKECTHAENLVVSWISIPRKAWLWSLYWSDARATGFPESKL